MPPPQRGTVWRVPNSATRSVLARSAVVILPLVVREHDGDDVVEDAANSAANLCVPCKDGKERDRCTETPPPHFLGCCCSSAVCSGESQIVGSAATAGAKHRIGSTCTRTRAHNNSDGEVEVEPTRQGSTGSNTRRISCT